MKDQKPWLLRATYPSEGSTRCNNFLTFFKPGKSGESMIDVQIANSSGEHQANFVISKEELVELYFLLGKELGHKMLKL